ncbi:uncharacterized protein LOC127796593 [Diospyros lotus]|uniref:uncharacterized protein LOC127796593 n=1 Tax=Diospyros lotus TaxID=55363 RepID=UPI0022580E99|nr:uncharacterized protein LOC127796593 [Diospyros lotus]
MALSPSPPARHNHWWLTNRMVVDKYVKEARILIGSREESAIASALSLLDAALAIAPRQELALELKARSLLYLRRFKDVADMLQEYIPSLNSLAAANDASSSPSSTASLACSDNSCQPLSRDRVKLLTGESPDVQHPSCKCFSVSDLKKLLISRLCGKREGEGQWRYLVLGQACCHLGLMEDAMLLLQTGKRLATAAFRRESVCLSDDSFSFSAETVTFTLTHTHPPQTPPMTESECIVHLLGHIKLLLRRKTAAIAALDAGLYSEAARYFSKIVDGRRGAPQAFLAECYLHRATAYRSSGRIADSIADCNRALALEPARIEALTTRASLFEAIRCLPDSLHDLEYLKLLYSSILRDRKLPGPAWKQHNVQYREVPGKLYALAAKIQELKERIGLGEIGNLDYYALMGLRRGCSRSELERAHLLLTLKHKPDKATSFVDRCDFADERSVDSARDRARMSALSLYRWIQKGYSSVMTTIMDEEAAEKQRKKAQQTKPEAELPMAASESSSSVFQGVFCWDIAAPVGSGLMIPQVGFNRPIPVKYEALSC